MGRTTQPPDQGCQTAIPRVPATAHRHGVPGAQSKSNGTNESHPAGPPRSFTRGRGPRFSRTCSQTLDNATISPIRISRDFTAGLRMPRGFGRDSGRNAAASPAQSRLSHSLRSPCPRSGRWDYVWPTSPGGTESWSPMPALQADRARSRAGRGGRVPVPAFR